jgi:hypothetical protein
MVGPPINWRDPDITCRILEIKAFFEEKPASRWAECSTMCCNTSLDMIK